MKRQRCEDPGRRNLLVICLSALVPFMFTGCSDPADFSSAANIGDLIRYTVDTGAGSYGYEILASDHGLEGTTKSGNLLRTGDYTYVPQDDPTRTLMVFPDTLLVGHMTLPVQSDGVFFAGVPANDGFYGPEDILGTYNWTGYSCERALVGGECPESYRAHLGTLRIDGGGTADLCLGGNVDDPTGHPCQTLDTLDWTDAGNGLIEFSLGGVPYATGMVHVGGGAEKVLAMALRNRPEGGYPGADRGPGIMVGVNKFAVPAASLAGLYLGAESGILLGEEDWYLKLLLRPDDTYLLVVIDLLAPDPPAYLFEGDLLLNVPWEGWIAQDNPDTVGYEEDQIAMVLPESGVLFSLNPTWATCFFAGGRLPSACTDADGDGYYVESQCLLPPDCDDTNPAVSPGLAEICDNGVDDDCDLQIDMADLDCFDTASNLPDTGITECYIETGLYCPMQGEPYYGQDPQYVTNPMSYTDNLDGTVTDNVTGLVWQQEDDDVERPWAEAVSYCEALTLAGHTDWRLPDLYELQGIVDYGGIDDDPAIDTTHFPGTEMAYYWSSSVPDGYGYPWQVNFGYGVFSRNYGGLSYFVRCVRGEQQERSFTDNGDGTVTDEATGLMWQRESDDVIRVWEGALSYCEGLTLADYTDWRLPDVKELASLVDVSRESPTIDPVFGGGAYVYTTSSGYWENGFDFNVFALSFDIGTLFTSPRWPVVRCVRQ